MSVRVAVLILPDGESAILLEPLYPVELVTPQPALLVQLLRLEPLSEMRVGVSKTFVIVVV